jgi:hypothetical protein
MSRRRHSREIKHDPSTGKWWGMRPVDETKAHEQIAIEWLA